jgi:hypothetical protein
MTRIRTIKPEFFRHEKLYEAEQTSKLPLRLSFAGLFVCCDREGRFRWRPRQLQLDILPYDAIDFSAVLEALASYGFIIQYQHQNEHYGYIPSWQKHQCINHREIESHLPSPHDENSYLIHSHENTDLAENNPPVPSDELEQVSDSPIFHEARVVEACITEFDTSSTRESRVNDASGTHASRNLTRHGHAWACPGNVGETRNASWACSGGIGREYGREGEKERELEKEQEGKRKGNDASTTREVCKLSTDQNNIQNLNSSNKDHPVKKIFLHWQTIMGHPQAQLDGKRITCISHALKLGYSEMQLCEAIEGCALTPHNMGVNSQGQRFDSLQLIFRDADQIDRFIHHNHHPPQPNNSVDQQRASNALAVKKWLSKQITTRGETI